MRISDWSSDVCSSDLEYRLAPENPFTAAVEDAWAVVGEIEADGPLFLLGDSAGGNLAAVTAQIARDRGAPRIDGQILIYPSVAGDVDGARSEEHTSELQSPMRNSYAVFFLKKKNATQHLQSESTTNRYTKHNKRSSINTKRTNKN